MTGVTTVADGAAAASAAQTHIGGPAVSAVRRCAWRGRLTDLVLPQQRFLGRLALLMVVLLQCLLRVTVLQLVLRRVLLYLCLRPPCARQACLCCHMPHAAAGIGFDRSTAPHRFAKCCTTMSSATAVAVPRPLAAKMRTRHRRTEALGRDGRHSSSGRSVCRGRPLLLLLWWLLLLRGSLRVDRAVPLLQALAALQERLLSGRAGHGLPLSPGLAGVLVLLVGPQEALLLSSVVPMLKPRRRRHEGHGHSTLTVPRSPRLLQRGPGTCRANRPPVRRCRAAGRRVTGPCTDSTSGGEAIVFGFHFARVAR